MLAVVIPHLFVIHLPPHSHHSTVHNRDEYNRVDLKRSYKKPTALRNDLNFYLAHNLATSRKGILDLALIGQCLTAGRTKVGLIVRCIESSASFFSNCGEPGPIACSAITSTLTALATLDRCYLSTVFFGA